MKTVFATNQSFQYLYSLMQDATIETIEALRSAKAIAAKTFSVVNAYELAKEEPVSRIKAIDNQIQLFTNAGKQTQKKDEIDALKARREQILAEEVNPLTDSEASVDLQESEIEFVLSEMQGILRTEKKMNTLGEMEVFDRLYTALETAEFTIVPKDADAIAEETA